jgi:hypothetical protein
MPINIDLIGEPGGIRTHDPMIKRKVLLANYPRIPMEAVDNPGSESRSNGP